MSVTFGTVLLVDVDSSFHGADLYCPYIASELHFTHTYSRALKNIVAATCHSFGLDHTES